MVFVISRFCDVSDAQEEQVKRRPASDHDSASAPVVATKGEITPPGVFVRVALIRDELELIRSEMGKPRTPRWGIEVTGAHPREVFYQALTLFRKANAMCFELTRQRLPMADVPQGEIRLADVWSVVNAALERIQRVKTTLDIAEKSREQDRDDSKTPTDVFGSIVEANRQLNLLLETRFAPADVFQQVTVAVGYASRLLARFPTATRIPAALPFERGKRPSDVFGRLLKCNRRLQAITERSGLEMLTFEWDSSTAHRVTPSDVYDLATLIVSELAYLHSRVADIEPPEDTYYSGRKLPSHVYQRAGILALQLEQLQRLVDENPNWLGSARAWPKRQTAGGGGMHGDNR